ncbi:MAG: hypothetical protein WDZ68_00675 [Candidatus Paceibacterota bacterium]
MWDKQEQKRLDSLRERLYARDKVPEKTKRKQLNKIEKEAPTEWSNNTREPSTERPTVPVTETAPVNEQPEIAIEDLSMPISKNKYSYRVKILFTAVFFFVAAAALSSLFILLGSNSISGENISISMNGPLTVGGGEELSVQVGITNRNNISIEAATLIIQYPEGTQTAGDETKQLLNERIQLNEIRSGETVNVPIRARVFGEENQEYEIQSAIEYRVSGSNATFFKESEPLRYKIGSSPVSIDIESVKSIAAGQEADIELTVNSNASVPLTNILIRAEYPSGFDFTQSSPNTVSGQNVWIIDELLPEESATIIVRGLVTGQKSDTRVVHFSVGVPSERDDLALASVFATASTEFVIEQAFLDVAISVNNSDDRNPSIEPGKQSNVRVEVTNTLDEAIYDAVVEVVLSGAALSDDGVSVSSGFYNSNTNTVVWDSTSVSRLAQMSPGSSETFGFSIEPDSNVLRTPQIDLSASVHARRTRESGVSGSLLGSAESSIKIASSVQISGEIGYDETPFNNQGPIPPVVGETTSYTVTLHAEGGSNDVTNSIVTTSLPTHVTWLNNTNGAGDISYNSSNRTVEWNIGDVDANDTVTASFQISLIPSSSQINATPTLVGEQQFRGEDRFTGTVVRSKGNALTTELANEDEYGERNGRVQEAD